MLCRRDTYAVPARSMNSGVRSDTSEAPLAVEKACCPSQFEPSRVNGIGQASFERAQHRAGMTAVASQSWIQVVLVEKTLDRAIGLHALHWSEVLPDQRNDSHGFKPTAGSPFVEVIRVG